MKAKLKPTSSFQVEIQGKCVGEFRVESEWNGFSKLVGFGGGEIIVNRPASFFSDLMKLDEEADVVRISPQLIPEKDESETQRNDRTDSTGA